MKRFVEQEIKCSKNARNAFWQTVKRWVPENSETISGKIKKKLQNIQLYQFLE